MAEVAFGLAASAVGVAGVAGQLASGVMKLNKFRNDFKDAPKEIHAVTEGLNTLLGIMSYGLGPASCANPAFHEALISCKSVAGQTLEMVARADQEMRDKRRTHKTLARLKAAFRKDELDDLLTKVQRAQMTLNTATMLDIRQQLKNLELVQAVEPQNRTRTKTVGRRKRPATNSEANLYRIQLPRWILSTIYEVGWEPAGRGWQCTLRALRVVPDDCDFFVACRQGDTATAKSLLDDGMASLLDVNVDGQTAMQIVFYAFIHLRSHVDLDKRRLELALDSLVRTVTLFLTISGQPFEESMQTKPEDAWTLFAWAWLFPWPEYRGDHAFVITEFAKMLPMCLSGATLSLNETYGKLSWTAVELLYSMPTYKQISWRPWSSVPIQERLIGYLGCGIGGLGDPDTSGFDPTAMIRSLGIDSFDLMWSSCDKWTTGILIRAMFDTITSAPFGDHDHCMNTALRFKHFISCCSYEQEMLHQTLSGRTFFREHLSREKRPGWPMHSEDFCKGAVCFANILKCLGFDLVTFGKAEIQCWLSMARFERYCWDGVELTWFDYGPEPNDWRVYGIERGPEYELVFAQDFWNLVEHPHLVEFPQLHVPGSWQSANVYPEDYKEDCKYYRPGEWD